MKFAILAIVLNLLLPLKSYSFHLQNGSILRRATSTPSFMSVSDEDGDTIQAGNLASRRSAMANIASSFIAVAANAVALPSRATAESNDKIVVFGGSGYVGAHIAQILSAQNKNVISVSRSSQSDQKDKVGKILGKSLEGVEYVSLDASTDDLTSVLKGASAVISCVGVAPGGTNQRSGNGAVNVRIADSAKSAGISRFVYISVASELANGPAKFLLGDYLKGKGEAEAAVLKDFGPSNSLVIKPAIIAGGPPGEIRPPGPPGVKPAGVRDVAKAAVVGALGEKSGTLDGNDAIGAI